MSCAIFPSEPAARTLRKLDGIRVSGGVSVRVAERQGASRVVDVGERDGYKVRFPRRADPPEAIIINTGGGLAAGDTVLQEFDVADRAALTVTTQAAERSYRSPGGQTTRLDVKASVGDNATLLWLPQETILFDDTRLARSISVDMAATARVLVAETVVFGRGAMGETLATGVFRDRWRIRRAGRLAFAENVAHADDAFRRSFEPAMRGGAQVAVSLVLVALDAEDRLAAVRAAITAAGFPCAASAWDGKLIVRGLAGRSEDVRRLMAALLPALDVGRLPRSWWT